jgi:RNA polymerase sigma-70 factor (ECF subfamily)
MLKRGDILPKVAAGDPAAVGACIDEYAGMVMSLAQRYLGASRSEVDDAVQDVFIEVWRSAGRFTPGPGSSEAAFIATTAHRRLIDAQRRAAARPRPSQAVSTDQAGAHIEHKPALHNGSTGADDVRRAVQAIDTLPAPVRDVMVLSFFHGLSHARIAHSVGVPIGTVKTRLRRGLIEVRDRLRATIGPAHAEPTPAQKGGEP